MRKKFFVTSQSIIYKKKKKRKTPLSTQERRAPQVYKGNPNQQPKERMNAPLSTQKVYQGTQKENPKQPKSSKGPK
jgi:hypothetical protein